jgi:hypothetical protein
MKTETPPTTNSMNRSPVRLALLPIVLALASFEPSQTVQAVLSQRRTEVKPMDKASETILAVKPVTVGYKKDLDSERHPRVRPRGSRK